MKKTLTILTIAILAILAFTSCVNAASIVTSAEKVDTEKPVTVTVKFDNPVRAVELNLKYDTNLFTYVSSDLGALGGSAKDLGGGVLRVAKFGQDGASTSEIKFNFTAKTSAGTGNFEIEPDTLITDTNDAVPAAATVAIVAPTPGGNPTTPTDPTTPTNPTTPKDNEEEKQPESETPVDKNGNPIKGLPNAGAPVFVGAIALIFIAGTVLVIRNRK